MPAATRHGAALEAARIANHWDCAVAAKLSPQELLLYSSNLLGSDKRVTNFGGGNTSAKLAMIDPLTAASVEVLCVKGNLNPRAPSIDTPLHAFIDRAHVDHMHPDAVIAIAASRDSRARTFSRPWLSVREAV